MYKSYLQDLRFLNCQIFESSSKSIASNINNNWGFLDVAFSNTLMEEKFDFFRLEKYPLGKNMF